MHLITRLWQPSSFNLPVGRRSADLRPDGAGLPVALQACTVCRGRARKSTGPGRGAGRASYGRCPTRASWSCLSQAWTGTRPGHACSQGCTALQSYTTL